MSVKQTLKNVVPESVYRPLLNSWRRARTRPADASAVTALQPLSRISGIDRGQPIDRFYLEQFLAKHRADIRGRVMETADARYTRQFGGDKVSQSDVLHLIAGNPEATIVGDLATGENIPHDQFDCVLCINTLLLIYDVRAALRHCHQALKPGGVLLVNFSGLYPRVPQDPAWAGDYWRFTQMSAQRLCEEVFEKDKVQVQTWGNVRSVSSYLYGLAAQDLTPEELNFHDPIYELVIGVRAVK